MATAQESRPATRAERFVQNELSRAIRRVRLLDLTRAALGLVIAVMAYGLLMMLADRWLFVLPVFSRPPGNPQGPYAMCYAVSATPDPLGPY